MEDPHWIIAYMLHVLVVAIVSYPAIALFVLAWDNTSNRRKS